MFSLLVELATKLRIETRKKAFLQNYGLTFAVASNKLLLEPPQILSLIYWTKRRAPPPISSVRAPFIFPQRVRAFGVLLVAARDGI
jgi:hypothetical protein